MKTLDRTDLFALVLSLLATLSVYWFVAEKTFEQLPHIEDEMAFVWQARVFAENQITIPSPPQPTSFFVPFVIDHNGQRFGKYPPGWPMMLSFGIRLGFRAWINPILAGLSIWLTYRLGQKIFSGVVGLLAAFLTATSPFFLVNAGSLLSHTWSFFLTLAFCTAWLDTFGIHDNKGSVQKVPKWMTVSTAGLALGLLAITRPVTALGIAAPFFLHGIYLLARGSSSTRKYVLAIGALTILVGSFLFVWQYDATGDPLLNPYTLYWPYDKVGFGEGAGRQDGGHSLYWVRRNLEKSIEAAEQDLFGWARLTWIFIPFGLWKARRQLAAWLSVGTGVGLAGFYATYWVTSTITGPRYYYEGIFAAVLLSAAGITWLAGAWGKAGKIRSTLVTILVAFLVGHNLLSYLPNRLASFHNLYGVQRADIEPFLTQEAEALTPALVFVGIQGTWTDYGALLDLEDPWLASPFIFVMGQANARNAAFAEYFPERQTIYYYPDEPNSFYSSPR